MDKRTVLHVGCGCQSLPPYFSPDSWLETRLDIDPVVKPEVICSMTDMQPIKEASFDAIWSSHNLEHLYAHEVLLALREFYRVLKFGGIAYLLLPDIQAVAAEVATGNLEGILYQSPAGPISAIDILWGHRKSIQAGNDYMSHKTGFTAQTLGEKLAAVGFRAQIERREFWELLAIAEKVCFHGFKQD